MMMLRYFATGAAIGLLALVVFWMLDVKSGYVKSRMTPESNGAVDG